MRNLLGLVLVSLVMVLLVTGCKTITSDEEQWIIAKADRMDAYMVLVDSPDANMQPTALQNKDMLRSQQQSWSLWRRKLSFGLAAPNWLADQAAQASTQPAKQ